MSKDKTKKVKRSKADKEAEALQRMQNVIDDLTYGIAELRRVMHEGVVVMKTAFERWQPDPAAPPEEKPNSEENQPKDLQ